MVYLCWIGALSMAVGEYISVSSQRDSEAADVETERRQQAAGPVARKRELVRIPQPYTTWEFRGGAGRGRPRAPFMREASWGLPAAKTALVYRCAAWRDLWHWRAMPTQQEYVRVCCQADTWCECASSLCSAGSANWALSGCAGGAGADLHGSGAGGGPCAEGAPCGAGCTAVSYWHGPAAHM